MQSCSITEQLKVKLRFIAPGVPAFNPLLLIDDDFELTPMLSTYFSVRWKT
jgi:hypothetical protein